ANFNRVLFGNLAKLRHRLAGEHLDLQPNLKLTFVRPDFAHLWPGIAIDHSGKIKAGGLGEKRFSLTKKTPTGQLSERELVVPPTNSANAGTHEAPVVLQTHLPTGEKVRHCCDRF